MPRAKSRHTEVEYWEKLSTRTPQSWKKLGFTREMYVKLLKKQGHECAICGREFSAKVKAKVDHDHTTGKVRGLLCNRCNTGLTMVENYAQEAIKYLQKPPMR